MSFIYISTVQLIFLVSSFVIVTQRLCNRAEVCVVALRRCGGGLGLSWWVIWVWCADLALGSGTWDLGQDWKDHRAHLKVLWQEMNVRINTFTHMHSRGKSLSFIIKIPQLKYDNPPPFQCIGSVIFDTPSTFVRFVLPFYIISLCHFMIVSLENLLWAFC